MTPEALKLPAVRFIRMYEPREHRMLNIWERVTTQEQLDDCPRATELTIQGQTIEVVLSEMMQFVPTCISLEAFKNICEIVDAQPSRYAVRSS
jgi:hypothetical protein